MNIKLVLTSVAHFEEDKYMCSPDAYLLAMLWPEHKELMLDLFEFFAIDAMEVGRPELSIPEFLKRERLYALKKLYEAELEQ